MSEAGKAREERVKLTAGYLNGVAVSTIAIGALAPVVGVLAGRVAAPWGIVALLFAGSVCLSVAIHYLARRSLEEMDR